MSIKHQDIVSAIETKMKTILIANGYHTDIGNNVFVWRTTPIQQGETTFMDIRDLKSMKAGESTGGNASFDDVHLPVRISVVSQPGASAQAQARMIIADVNKAIGADPTWGGKAIHTFLGAPDNMRPEGTDMMAAQDDRKLAGADINFYVLYRTTKFQES